VEAAAAAVVPAAVEKLGTPWPPDEDDIAAGVTKAGLFPGFTTGENRRLNPKLPPTLPEPEPPTLPEVPMLSFSDLADANVADRSGCASLGSPETEDV